MPPSSPVQKQLNALHTQLVSLTHEMKRNTLYAQHDSLSPHADAHLQSLARRLKAIKTSLAKTQRPSRIPVRNPRRKASSSSPRRATSPRSRIPVRRR